MEFDLSDTIGQRLKSKSPPGKEKGGMRGPAPAESSIANAEMAFEGRTPGKKSEGGHLSYVIKDFFDRVSYGLSSSHFLNILLSLIGGSILLVGLANAAKAILSTAISLLSREYSRKKSLHKRTVGYSAVLLGISFILVSASVFYRAVWLFVPSFLLGAVSAVVYGNLYQNMFRIRMVEIRKVHIIGRLTYTGLLVTAMSIWLGAWLLESFGINGKAVSFELFGRIIGMRLFGYAIALNMAAVSIVISGYIIYFLYWKKIEEKTRLSLREAVNGIASRYAETLRATRKDKVLSALAFTGIIIAALQALGNSYFAIFIFRRMAYQGFGGWMNVAVVFIMALIATIVSPYVTRSASRAYGRFPLLAFGACLMAIMPLSYYYRPTLISVAMGTIAGVLGASINGIATGIILKNCLKDIEMGHFLQMKSISSIPFYAIIIPLGACLAYFKGMETLFLAISAALVLAVLPVYIYVIAAVKSREKL